MALVSPPACGFHRNRWPFFLRIRPAYVPDTEGWSNGTMLICEECHKAGQQLAKKAPKREETPLVSPVKTVDNLSSFLNALRSSAA